jgi:hypothetical protein
MTASGTERTVLRDLAARVAEAAADPIQVERAQLIKRLNHLQPIRPVVLAFPEGGWPDLVPEASLQCHDELLRQWESHLRGMVFRHEMIRDDYPITADFAVLPVVHTGDFGLHETRQKSEAHGSYTWDAPVKSPEDLAKLHVQSVEVDHAETARRMDRANDLFGDILRVRRHGMLWWTAGLTQEFVFLRGLEQMMYDMYDHPQFVHDLMALLRDNMMHRIDTLEAEGVLWLNNGPNDYVGSGGLGYTDELPAKDFDGTVRPRDMWVLSESQETVGVGPDQFEEFILPYQKPLMERFGLVCYGCCEPVDKRLDLLLREVPNLRRVSISPWCDREVAAEKLGDRHVFSWKPNPSHICSPTPAWKEAEHAIAETLRMARGCCIEMIMKDTHTFSGDPTRIGRWVQMARAAAENA